MRSSKNRSRSKGNRNRSGSVGNVVNRVFDSSGPQGKVRGTPQQIVDKYNQLTRDAQLSHDRVAAESFQQHAEHYLRMLAEAQREMDAKNAQQQAQQGNQQGGQQGGNQQGGNQQGGNQQGGNQQGGGNRRNRGGGGGGGGGDQQPAQTEQPHAEAEPQGSFDAVIESTQGEGGLVETPENTPKPKRPRTRRRKADAPPPVAPAVTPDAASDGATSGADAPPPQETAE
ncbi:MAG: DUF4167 domain-containing protein [Roseicyclus sp.]|nr:DUF4167 domain-containing protein [Roseicyclus sp.]